MYEVKSKIFLYLTKNQKSALCNYLRAFTKKWLNLSADEILEKFLEDERYYLEINASRFEFMADYIEDSEFLSQTNLLISEFLKYYEYKKSQEPIRQAQKEFDKKKRKFLQEVKMSKEFPTKKQISYYNSLCKRYNIQKKDTKDLSKLDLRNLIDGMLNEAKTD